jgi:hypothetical protein
MAPNVVAHSFRRRGRQSFAAPNRPLQRSLQIPSAQRFLSQGQVGLTWTNIDDTQHKNTHTI